MMIRAFILLILLLPALAAAQTTVYVDTASTAGGDGTSELTTGSTRAFATLQAAINAKTGAVPAGGYIFDCKGTAADTSAIYVDGFTGQDATKRIKIQVRQAYRHDGKWNSGKYRIEASHDSAVFRINEEFVTVEGLQISQTVGATGAYGDGIQIASGAPPGTDLARNEYIFDSNIIRATAGAAQHMYATGMNLGEAENYTRTYLRNNIIYDFEGSGINIVSSGGNVGEHYFIYNNTVINGGSGINWQAYGTDKIFNCHNNIFISTTGNDLSNGESVWGTNGTISTVGNVCEDASCDGDPGGEDLGPTSASRTVVFVDRSGKDFHLDAADTGAKDFSSTADLSGITWGAFSNDIDGGTRSGQWDAGADEIITGGGGSAAIAALIMDGEL